MSTKKITDADEFYTPKGMFRKYGYVTHNEKGKYWGRTAKASKSLALGSRMMAPVDSPNSKGYDVKR